MGPHRVPQAQLHLQITDWVLRVDLRRVPVVLEELGEEDSHEVEALHDGVDEDSGELVRGVLAIFLLYIDDNALSTSGASKCAIITLF